MKKFLDNFKGMKTYVISIMTGGMGIFLYMKPEFVMPEYVWAILAAAGLGAVRDAIPEKK